MDFVRKLIVIRHGHYPHNTMIDEEGDELLTRLGDLSRFDSQTLEIIRLRAIKDFMARFPLNHDAVEHISSIGQLQAERVKGFLGKERDKVAVCLTSPYGRAQDTAEIIFGDTSVPCAIDNNLRERNLGAFSHLPRRVFHKLFAHLAALKEADPLNYRPLQLEGDRLVPIPESHADRLPALQKVLARVDGEAANGLAVLSTHADTMAEFRMLPRLLGLGTNEKLTRPLASKVPNPLWIQNCEIDMYEERRSRLTGYMTHFRNVICHGDSRRDTRWLVMPR